MAGWAAWSPVKERDKLGVVTYNYQVLKCEDWRDDTN